MILATTMPPDPDDLLDGHSGDPTDDPHRPHLLDPDYREPGQTRAGRWLLGRWLAPDEVVDDYQDGGD